MANISTIKVGSTSYGITPASHASTATTYGAATASKYGHVKLSDNYTSSAGAAASGIGASSAAVYNAYNTLNSKLWNLVESGTKTISKSSHITISTSPYSNTENSKCMGILITATMSSGGPQASYLGMEFYVSSNTLAPISLADQSTIFSISIYSGGSPGCVYKIDFSSTTPPNTKDILCNYNLYVIWI